MIEAPLAAAGHPEGDEGASSRMKKTILIGYLILFHVFLVLVLAKTDFLARMGERLGFSFRLQSEITKDFKQMMEYHERMDDNVPDGAIIFIGDSLIQGLCVSAIACPSVNFGIGMDTTVGVMARLPKYRALERAGACVLAIGLNDLQRRGNEEILKNYSSILRSIPKGLPVIISAVLPVDERVSKIPGRRNRRIKELNIELQSLCEQTSPSCTFVDPGSKLLDSSGNLNGEFNEGDGVHLNGAGNAIWIQDLKHAILKAQTGYHVESTRN